MPTSPSNRPTVAVSMGDPSGIGPEIVLKTLSKPSIQSSADFIIVGDRKVLERAGSLVKACQGPARKAAVMDMKNVPMKSFSFGREKAAYGRAAVEYIKRAYDLVAAGEADCIVTAPISKSAARMSGFAFPGHTEFLASLAGVKKFVMMLVGGPLKVSLVTRHMPLGDVPRHLSVGNISDTIDMTLDSLKTDFGIAAPRIGVCGLNPHAGEGGMCGTEEARKIAPAVAKFSRRGVKGPIPADALFYDAYRKRFDAVVCLYHDQGLIPLKMIARDSGVNITLGLKFVRTSPDHGTAFDIAGKGKADPRSMENAVKTAVSMAANRKRHAK